MTEENPFALIESMLKALKVMHVPPTCYVCNDDPAKCSIAEVIMRAERIA